MYVKKNLFGEDIVYAGIFSDDSDEIKATLDKVGVSTTKEDGTIKSFYEVWSELCELAKKAGEEDAKTVNSKA